MSALVANDRAAADGLINALSGHYDRGIASALAVDLCLDLGNGKPTLGFGHGSSLYSFVDDGLRGGKSFLLGARYAAASGHQKRGYDHKSNSHIRLLPYIMVTADAAGRKVAA